MLFHCHAVSTHSIQCGLLEGLGGTKRVHIAVLFTPASWIGWKKPCEKKSSTMDTEEVHNANSFPNTTDCFHHNEGKQPLLLSSTSTNNTLTKPPNPRFVPRQNLLDHLNAPRVEKKFFQLSSPFSSRKKYNKKAKERERNSHRTRNASSLTDLTTFPVFWSDSNWIWPLYHKNQFDSLYLLDYTTHCSNLFQIS